MNLERIIVFVYLLAALSIAGFSALLARLLWTRLAAVYPWFVLYLTTDILMQVGRIKFAAYHVQLFQAGQALRVILAVAVLRELVRHAFSRHPALGAFIRRGSWYIIGASVAVAFLAWTVPPPRQEGRSLELHHFWSAERAVTAGLFAYLVAIIVFMGWFPVRTRRNVLVLMIGFVAYFAARCVQLFGVDLSFAAVNWVNLFDNAVALICAGSWMMLITREGEEIETVSGHRWNPVQIGRLSQKLDSINASLVRMGQ